MYEHDQYADEQEIIRLKEAWYDRLRIFALSYIRDPLDAEDLVQDTLVKLWESRIDLTVCENIGALLYTILKNKCLDYIKHRVVRLRHDMQMQAEYNFLLTNQYALEDESINIITNNQIKEALSIALAKLPEQTRNVFVMSKLKGRKQKEIAEELGVSIKTVEYHIGRAFMLLKKELGGYYTLLYLIIRI